jgi:HD-GYP domain-containing protein (c-di-GMP phosphodiesterase class II)
MANILEQSFDVSKILITPGEEEEKGFMPVPLRNLTVGRRVPFDVYFKVKTQDEAQLKFIKCVPQGEIFQKAWHQKLLQLQISSVYIALEEMERLRRYSQGHLQVVLGSNDLSKLEKGVQIRDAAQMWTYNFFNNEGVRNPEEIKQAQQFLEPLCGVIKGERQNLAYLMKIKSHKCYRLHSHSLNVCLLGMAFTSYLGWSSDKILGFGLGALLHDIGLTRTPQDILDKKGKLTTEEMSKVRRHPVDGFRMMQAFVNMRVEALRMIMQHHENGNGSGYPQGLKLHDIHPWSRILRILDSYEAMTAERPWRPAMEPKEALWIMRTDWEKSKLFDLNFLSSFVRFLAGG